MADPGPTQTVFVARISSAARRLTRQAGPRVPMPLTAAPITVPGQQLLGNPADDLDSGHIAGRIEAQDLAEEHELGLDGGELGLGLAEAVLLAGEAHAAPRHGPLSKGGDDPLGQLLDEVLKK